MPLRPSPTAAPRASCAPACKRPASRAWRDALRFATALGLACALAACALQPRRDYPWHPSPNFDQRRPHFIVIHHTTNATVEKALDTLTSATRRLSAHYLIGRDGRILQLVNDLDRAWHAGKSWWGGHADLNSISIGIELDNTGFEPFAEPQIESLIKLMDQLVERYRIPRTNIVGHGDVAPGRKVDPSAYFPWRLLAGRGFGLWCDQPAMTVVPPGFDPVLGLMAIGYDVSRPEVARQAFRRHFLATESEGDWTPDEARLVKCLIDAKLAPPTRTPAPGNDE